MNYLERLISASEKFNSIICMGLDPVLEDIPVEGEPGDAIYIFYETILDKMVQTGTLPGAVKPNYAFYAQYGLEGIDALQRIIRLYKNEGLPVILDVKRGDIGKTAAAYAREAFDFFGADAVTLSPYLGYDSVSPFISGYPDRGYYILTRTSNKSASDFQDLGTGTGTLFMRVAEKILEWYHPGIGSVVGATYPEELSRVSSLFTSSGKDVPLLIPGIGAQGGDLDETLRILDTFPDRRIHRINSSSGINYAYKKLGNLNYADAAVTALKELNSATGN